MIRKETNKYLLWVVLLSALIITAAIYIPWRQDEEPIVNASLDMETVQLKPGDTVEQSFWATDNPISGVVLFSPPRDLGRVGLQVRILDDQKELGQVSMAQRYEFRVESFWAILYGLDEIEMEAGESLRMEVTNISNKDVVLIVNGEDFYGGGSFTGGDFKGGPYDLAFSILHQEPASFGTKQGVLVGIMMLLGSVLISIIPKYKWILAGVLVTILLPLAVSGFWFSTGDLGISDWDFNSANHEGYRKTILEHKQFPFWNPYFFGGESGLGDSEFPVLSYTFVSELILGVPIGFKVALYITVVLSGLGTLVLAKRLGLSVQAALLAAFAYSLSVACLLNFVEGHIQFMVDAWIPWVFWAWYRAYQLAGEKKLSVIKNPWILITGIILAVMFYQGGIYVLFYLIPGLFLFYWLAGRPKDALKITLGAGFWSFGLSAFKVIPVINWLREFPDDYYHVSIFSIPYWYDIYLRRHLHGVDIIPGQGGGWHEHGAYIGPVILVLLLLGCSQLFKRRVIRILMVGAVITVIVASTGPWTAYLFDMVSWLPRSNVSRINAFAVFTIALLAAFGLDALNKHSSGKGKVIVPLIVGLVAIDIMSLAYPMAERAFIVPAVVPAVEQSAYPIAYTLDMRRIRQDGRDSERTYAAVLAGWGTLTYRPPLTPPLGTKPATGNDASEYLTSSNDKAVLELLDWSPTKVKVRVSSEQEHTVVINSNFSRGWKVNGQPAVIVGYRLGAIAPAGEHELVFKYRPPGYLVGLIITLITIIVAITTRTRFARWLRRE